MEYDPLIYTVAYNMTGHHEATRDVVQDIRMKLLEKPIDDAIADKRNYLIRMVINHCLNLKQHEKRIRYVGTWLPEPVPFADPSVHQQFEMENLLCYELAFLIDVLTPLERAVFVLRESFDFDHKEIAESIHVTSDYSRQLYKRAKAKIPQRKHLPLASGEAKELAFQFVKLIGNGDVDALIGLFNEDISMVSDGGGKAAAIKKPIFGRTEVAAFLIKVSRNSRYKPKVKITEVLAQPAICVFDNDKCILVQVLSVNEGRISQVFSVLNPDKLTFFNDSVT